MSTLIDYMPECAFCGDPIDYCQGHPFIEYAVRVHHDGELVQPIEFYSDDAAALERMEALVIAAEPGDTIDVFDQAGDVLASESITIHA